PQRGCTVVVLSLAALLAGCGSDARNGADATAAVAVGYVGSEACAPCHAEAARTWAASRHHAAMLAADPGAPLRAEPSADGPLVGRDGRLWMSGASLDEPHDVALSFVLGRKHVEQYVGALVPGRLQALPRAFDVRGRDWFDLFEGETRTREDW